VRSGRPVAARDGAGGWVRTAGAALVACALSALCITVALWPADTEGPRTKRIALPSEISACATDDDCVVVDRIGCCTCQTGGGQWAVNATQTDPLRRFLKHNCKHQPACLQIDACRRDLRATCRGSTCIVEVIPAADADEPAHG
jgi:hypothetical protein